MFPTRSLLLFLFASLLLPSAATAQFSCRGYKRQVTLAEFALEKTNNQLKRAKRAYAKLDDAWIKFEKGYEVRVQTRAQGWCKRYFVFVDILGAPASCVGGAEVGEGTPYRLLADASQYPLIQLKMVPELYEFLRLKYGDEAEVDDGDDAHESKAERQLRQRKEAAIVKLRAALMDMAEFDHAWNLEKARLQAAFERNSNKQYARLTKSFGSLESLTGKLAESRASLAFKRLRYENCKAGIL